MTIWKCVSEHARADPVGKNLKSKLPTYMIKHVIQRCALDIFYNSFLYNNIAISPPCGAANAYQQQFIHSVHISHRRNRDDVMFKRVRNTAARTCTNLTKFDNS